MPAHPARIVVQTEPLPVLWHQNARGDLLGILSYIADRNPDAAQRLRNRLLARTTALGDNPGLGRAGRIDGTRELVAHRNYLVVYAVHPDHILILAVMHARRDWA